MRGRAAWGWGVCVCVCLWQRCVGEGSSCCQPTVLIDQYLNPPRPNSLVLAQNKKELLTNWWNEGKLEASEELGDQVSAAGDKDMALKIYQQCGASGKVGRVPGGGGGGGWGCCGGGKGGGVWGRGGRAAVESVTAVPHCRTPAAPGMRRCCRACHQQ